MRSGKIKLEHGLYGLALMIALLIRFLSLGTLPLTNYEAGFALQAFNLSRGLHPLIGPQPGYILLTTALFFMLGSGVFLARFWAALVGSLLVLAPSLFHQKIGRQTAILLAFFLAFDPGLVAMSRQADGTLLAITFSIFTIGFFLKRKPIFMGISAGLALLGGTAIWPGIASLVIAFFWTTYSRRNRKDHQKGLSSQDILAGQAETVEPFSWMIALAWAVGTIFFIGTLFFTFPQGLSAMAYSLVYYIKGWGLPTGISPLEMLASLVVYTPIGLILGLWGVAAGLMHKDQTDLFLARWLLLALLLAFFYPARQMGDLVWIMLPMWALAARQVYRVISARLDNWFPSLGQAVLVFILLVFGWMNIGWFTQPVTGSNEVSLRLAAVIGALILILLIAILVAWGWSIQASGEGAFWGFTLFLLLYSLSATWNGAGMGRLPGAELWRTGSYVKQGDQLMRTLGDVSEWHSGRRDSLDLIVVNPSEPALQWLLRNWRHVRYLDTLPLNEKPSLIITSTQQPPSLAAAYTGQGFTMGESPAWEVATTIDLLRWLLYREIGSEKTGIVLWVRTDLFPGAAQNPINPLP
ncbi:MAG: hypothetical protein IMZ61_09365 [Planctomycetes bacterium]|nr:hypothetical protein [Planctomycetota bacterium]